MDSNRSGVKQQLDNQVDLQQQQQPVAKRRHVVNVADACIAEGGSSAVPVEGSAPGSSSSASNWILIDDDNVDTVTWSRSDRSQLLAAAAAVAAAVAAAADADLSCDVEDVPC
jgi:hypothetical protein